jgi:hypothetical protein
LTCIYCRASYHTKRLRKGRHITTAYVRQAIKQAKDKSLHCPQLDHNDADELAGQTTWRTTQTTMRSNKYAIYKKCSFLLMF